MSYGVDIQRGLTKQFATILNSYTVAWPNRKFNTPAGSNWLEFNILPGGIFEQTLSDTDRVNGIVQIDVYSPKFKGEDVAFQVADLLNAQLPKNNQPITENQTDIHIRTVSQPRVDNDENWHKMMIDISFYAMVPR